MKPCRRTSWVSTLRRLPDGCSNSLPILCVIKTTSHCSKRAYIPTTDWKPQSSVRWMGFSAQQTTKHLEWKMISKLNSLGRLQKSLFDLSKVCRAIYLVKFFIVQVILSSKEFARSVKLPIVSLNIEDQVTVTGINLNAYTLQWEYKYM